MYKEQYGEYTYWCEGVKGLGTQPNKIVHFPHNKHLRVLDDKTWLYIWLGQK